MNGQEADFYSAEKVLHPYDYPDNFQPKKCPKSSNTIVNKILLVLFLIKLIIRYKYFIFLQAGWSLMKDQRDIKLLRLFKKKTMVVFVGCDTRIPEKVDQFKWNPCTECPDEYKNYVNCDIPRKKIVIPKIEKRFDVIASPDECAGMLEQSYFSFHFPRRLDHFTPVIPKIKSQRRIKILHAPSNAHYKGTKYVREAISKLANDHRNFEYIEKQGLHIDNLHKLISSCDLIIDQMLVGYYGLLSVESMALGKPVVVYMRPDIWEMEKEYSPVFNANPDNLLEVLSNICKDPYQLEQKGIASRAYVEKFHDAKIVANEVYLKMSSC